MDSDGLVVFFLQICLVSISDYSIEPREKEEILNVSKTKKK